MTRKSHDYLVKEIKLAKNAEDKTAEFVNKVCRVTLEAFWTQNVKGKEGFDRIDSMLKRLGAGWIAFILVALLSEGKYDVIISAPNRGVEMENLRPLRAELPAVWSDISNAMRGFKNHSLHLFVLDEVLSLELSKFSRQLKLKPGIDDEHRVIVAMSNYLWFRGMEIKEGGDRRKNYKETRAVKGKDALTGLTACWKG